MNIYLQFFFPSLNFFHHTIFNIQLNQNFCTVGAKTKKMLKAQTPSKADISVVHLRIQKKEVKGKYSGTTQKT